MKVNRSLRGIDARMIQQSVWEFCDPAELEKIARTIRSSGGRAMVLEKKVV